MSSSRSCISIRVSSSSAPNGSSISSSDGPGTSARGNAARCFMPPGKLMRPAPWRRRGYPDQIKQFERAPFGPPRRCVPRSPSETGHWPAPCATAAGSAPGKRNQNPPADPLTSRPRISTLPAAHPLSCRRRCASERGLAAAARAEQRDQLALLEGIRDIFSSATMSGAPRVGTRKALADVDRERRNAAFFFFFFFFFFLKKVILPSMA